MSPIKILAFVLSLLFSLFLPVAALAGSYEDLEEAMIRKDSAAVIKLIERGVDINTVDRSGNSLLTQAVRQDNAELFDALLARRARLNTRNRNGETALSIAAFTGKMPYVNRLVEAGAEVNFFRWPPLAYAAFNGHTAIAEYLLKRGADIDAKTENGSTALFFAARYGHLDTVKLLLSHEADVSIANESDETAVDWAMKGRNTDIVDLLRAAGGRAGKSVKLEIGN